MSLDVYLHERPDCGGDELFWANVTHNLVGMADAAGLYEPLWRPEEAGITRAEQLVEPLRKGLIALLTDPDKFKALEPKNGWGSYTGFCGFVVSYMVACENNPEAYVDVSR